MARVVPVALLSIESGILAALVAAYAAWQSPNLAAGRRALISGSPNPNGSTWIEQNPLLFGGAVALAVFLLGVLIISARSRRPA